MAVLRKQSWDVRFTDTLEEKQHEYLLNRKSIYNIPPLTVEAAAAEVAMSPGQPLTAAGGIYSVKDVRGLFLIPVDDFQQGAGQDSYDVADASPARFQASRYLDISKAGEASIGMSRQVIEESLFGGTFTVLGAGGYVWATSSDDNVLCIDGDGVVTECTGLDSKPVQALCSDGEYIYAAQTTLPGTGNDGSVSRCLLGDTEFNEWSTAENIVGMAYSAGSIFAVRANWYNGSTYVTQGGMLGASGFTPVTAVGTLFPNSQHRGLCAVEGECFWLVASDEQGSVQAWTYEDGSYRNAYTLPDGFCATSICGYMGAIYVGGYFEDNAGAKVGAVYIGTLDTSVSAASITKLVDIETNPDFPSEVEAVRGLIGHRRHLYILTDSNLHRWSLAKGGISHVCRCEVPVDDVAPVPPDFEAGKVVYNPQVNGIPKNYFTRTLKAGTSATKDITETLITRAGGGVNISMTKDTAWAQYFASVPTMALQHTAEISFSPGYYTDQKHDGKVTQVLTGIVASQGVTFWVDDGDNACSVNIFSTKPTLVTVKKNKKYKQTAKVYVQVANYDAGAAKTTWKRFGPYDPTTAMRIRVIADADKVMVFKDDKHLQTLQRGNLMGGTAKGIYLQVGPGADKLANKVRLASVWWHPTVTYAPSWAPTVPEVNSMASLRGRIYCPLDGGYVVTDPVTPHVPTGEDPCYLRLSKSSFHMNGVDKGFYALWVDHSKLEPDQSLVVSYELDDSPATALVNASVEDSSDVRSLFLLQQSGNRINAQVGLIDPAANTRDLTNKLRVYGITSAFVVPTIMYYTFNILAYDRTEDRSGGLWDNPADEAIDFLFQMAGVGRVVNVDLGYDSFLGVIKTINEQPGSRQDQDTSAHQGVVSVKVQRL